MPDDHRIRKCSDPKKKGWIQELLSPGRELTSGSKYLTCRWVFRSVKIDCRIRKCRIRREECRIQELLSPGRELISGSKYLNCRWIFRSVKLIDGSESVGSAEKSVGSGSKSDAEPCREVLRPKLLKSGMNSKRLSKGMVSYWNRRGSKVQLQTDPDPRQKSEQIRTRRSGLRYLPNLT